MKIKYIIYMATSKTSGKSYIGMTVRSMATRRREHEASAIKGNPGHFQRALSKHGFNDFKWVVLDTAETHKELVNLEVMWIKRKNTFEAGYNLTSGGEQGVRGPQTAEHKRKLKEARLRRTHRREHLESLLAAKKARAQVILR